MNRADTLAAVMVTCEDILSRRKIELVEVVLAREPGGQVLRITVDGFGRPVNLQEITEISGEISRALDVDDPIEGHYTLEVASAGLERPLVKPSDYVRFAGREVKVKCLRPIEGRRNFQGAVLDSDQQGFVLETSDGLKFEIPFDAVVRTKLTVDWEKELKGLGGQGPPAQDFLWLDEELNEEEI